MTGQEARDDEREALAAEILRADEAMPTGSMTLADWSAHLSDAILSAGYRKHPEPEWEYGLYEEDPHRERERPHRAYNGAHLVSDNRAHVEAQWRKGHPSIKFVKRQKAGPWVPVGEGEQK